MSYFKPDACVFYSHVNGSRIHQAANNPPFRSLAGAPFDQA